MPPPLPTALAARPVAIPVSAHCRLAPPVLATDLALAIAGVATGRVEVEESVRRAGVTTFSQVRERDQYEIADTMRHVDGTEAIVALAREAQAAMEGAYAA